MNRRDTVKALLALGAAPLAAKAQQAGKIPRLCFLTFDPGMLTRFNAFFDGLRDLGYVDGRTIIIDYLSADGRDEQFPALAVECLRRKADIIAVQTTPAAQAAKKATRTIPIVMVSLGDPVGTGLVDSLARPGGNVTGTTFMAPVLAAKRLEILKEVVPQISRVLVLTYPLDPIANAQLESLKSAARSLRMSLLIREIRTVDDLPAAFDAAAREGAEGLTNTNESIFTVHRVRLIELAARHRLPAIYTSQLFVTHGGLMGFGADFPPFYASTALYVDKILKGAKPAELPVEQATKFEFSINLKTAKALGLSIPKEVLFRADKVIE